MEKQILSILHGYDIGNIHSINILEGGHVCSNYKIKTNSDIYVLRIRPSNFSFKELESDHCFLSYLKENNFPVPEIIINKEGNTFGFTSENQPYELQKYIPHDKDLNDYSYRKTSNQLTHLLGRLHQISSKYPETIVKPSYVNQLPVSFLEKYFDGPLSKGFKRYEKTADLAHRTKQKEFKQKFNNMKRILSSVKKQMASNSIPEIVNHNDFYGNNILFKNNKIVGLIDFDLCMNGPYFIDLVEQIHGSIVWHDEEEAYWGLHPDGEISWENGRKDLKTYFKYNPDLNFNEKLFREFLKVKIISLAFHPTFDIVKGVQDRLEVLCRIEKVMNRINAMNSLV